MDNNLVSLNYLRDQLKNLEDFSMSLNGEVPSEISELKSSVSNFFQESALFMEKFFQRGWCLYESMDFNLVQRVNSEYEKNGIDKAEWEQESSTRTETLRFNCVYFGLKEDDNLVAPRRENGEWRLIPLDVEKIFY
ncbi:hypothetical protein ACTGYB_07150 [Streptococcus suis]